MPLHDHSYRRLDGPRTPRWKRSWALARSASGLLLRRRSFLLLLALSWVPAIVRAVQIYIARQFPGALDFLTITPDLFREFLGQQVRFLPVVLVALATGASAIATDFASGAFTIYLSKPISRLDYFLGKAVPVAAAVLAVTVAPALVLLFLHLGLAPDFTLLSRSPSLPLSVATYGAFLAAYYTLLVLAVSSLCRSGRLAGAGFAALVFGSEIAARTAGGRAFGATRLPSVNGAAIDAGNWFFGGPLDFTPLAFVAFVLLVSALVLDRRLRSGEAAL
jgi:hypothetical protein